MIVVDEKTEVEPEKKVWEMMGVLRDGWELRSMEKEVITTVNGGSGEGWSISSMCN